MSLSDEEYLRYLDDFNSFPMEPSKLRDLCFNSMIDAATTTLILSLAETVLEAQQLLLESASYPEDPETKKMIIPESSSKRYQFLVTQINYCITSDNFQKQIQYCRPYSATYLKYNKKTHQNEPRRYIDDLAQKIQHYSDMLEPISHSLQVIYS